MRSKRFGCIEPFISPLTLEQRRGRPAMGEEFFKALLTYGSFDAFDVFCPDVESHRQFTVRLEEAIPDATSRKRVEVSLRIALHEAMTTRQYAVFHTSDAQHALPALARMRNQYACSAFPVTAMMMPGLSAQRTSAWMELGLGGLQPYDAVVCPSEAVKTTVRGQVLQLGRLLGPERVQIPRLENVCTGIDPALLTSMDKAEARALFRMDAGWTVAVSVGRISAASKLDWGPTLEMLTRLQDKGHLDRTLFVIAGAAEPVDAEILQIMIRDLGLTDRVLMFQNFQPAVQKTLLAAADFFVAPIDNPRAQACGAMREAMAAGLPVLASDYGPSSEFLDNGVEGILVPTMAMSGVPDFIDASQSLLDPALEQMYMAQSVAVDINALEDAFVLLASDPARREAMGAKAREKAKRWSWPVVIREWEALWTELSATASRMGKVAAPATQDLASSQLDAAFGHYPSMTLSDEQMIGLNPRVQPNSLLVRYDDVRICIFEPLECYLMETLTAGPMELDHLRQQAAKTLNVSTAYVNFHVMWLLKHGRLACVTQR